MTKTLALVAEGLRRAPWLPDAEVRRRELVEQLKQRRGPNGWGYEFDVQTRWGYYPAGSPNMIVSAFTLEASHAFLADDERSSIADWLAGPMWTGNYFRYVTGNDACIHNANLLGARALYRLVPSDERVRTAAMTTIEALPPRGLWPYGETALLNWVDNFHTAYVLDALMDLREVDDRIPAIVEDVAGRYMASCFAPDGRPYYFAGGAGPVDVHNAATALLMVARLAKEGLVSRNRADQVLTAVLALEQRPGEFANSPTATTYARWNQGHVHRALSEVTSP